MMQEFRVVLRFRLKRDFAQHKRGIFNRMTPQEVRSWLHHEMDGSELGEMIIEEVTEQTKPHEEER